jgi:hypothetical protein
VVTSVSIIAVAEGCRQMKQLFKAFANNFDEVRDIWMQRPPFRVLLDFIEECAQHARDGAE